MLFEPANALHIVQHNHMGAIGKERRLEKDKKKLNSCKMKKSCKSENV